MIESSIDIIADHKNRFKGETAFILGSGPSISGVDLSCLKGRLIFTVNGSTLLQEKFALEPAYFCTSDSRFLNSSLRDLATTRVHPGATRLVRDVIRPYDDHSLGDRTIYARTIAKNGFSPDFRQGFYFWCTSISLGVQMAWFTGVQRVVLLGIDLNYSPTQPRFYEEATPQPVDPFLSIQVWNIAKAAKTFEEDGREFISCGEKSMLRPYVEYRPFEETL